MRKGGIYRIKMHNFLTFTDTELFPGNRLNVIIGPNGTGKSSIVCAICIGLAGNTKSVMRSDQVKDYVKKGETSGYVEIELYQAN